MSLDNSHITHLTKIACLRRSGVCLLVGSLSLLIAYVAQISAESNITNLYNLCARQALTTLSGDIIDISFDIAVDAAPATDERQQPSATMQEATSSEPLYSACHVRILNNGVMQTAHFDIKLVDGLTVIQPQLSDSSSTHISPPASDEFPVTTPTSEAAGVMITGSALSIIRSDSSVLSLELARWPIEATIDTDNVDNQQLAAHPSDLQLPLTPETMATQTASHTVSETVQQASALVNNPTGSKTFYFSE